MLGFRLVRISRLAAVVAAGVLGATAVSAQEFPARTMQAVIGFPAGSGADIMCRYFATKAGELAGQSIVIVNKPGAFGSLSYAQVASAKPDGYTILMAGNALMSASRAFIKTLPFDRKSFVPATSFAETPFIVTVAGSATLKTVPELISHLKAKPRNRYGTNNPANVAATAYLRSLTGFEAEAVTYKAAADALADVSNGTLDFMIFDGAFAIGQIRSGKLKALAVTSIYRLPAIPDVPTMQQAGFKDFDFNPWWGVYLPAGTPPAIVEKVGGWFAHVAKLPETAKQLEPMVLVPSVEAPAKMNAKLDADGLMWERSLKAAGVEPQ